MEEQTVGIGDVLLHLLVDTCLVHHRIVGASVFKRLAASNDEGWDILRERGAGLNHCQASHTGVGILDSRTGEDDTIVDLAVARNLHTITEYAVVAHHRVVTDMHAFQEEVVVTDLRHAIAMGTPVDDHILADDIVVANLYIRLLTTEVEVLWQGGNDRALVDLVVLSDARAVADADEGEDDTVVTDLHIVLDIYEGEYLTVVADLRLWADLGFGTYFTCHNSSVLFCTSA